MAGLAESQWWPADQLREGQSRQLEWLLRWSARQVPHYGQTGGLKEALARLAADPSDVWAAWQQVPLLTKVELRSREKLLNARSLAAAHLPLSSTRTSGSLGIPVEVRGTAVSRRVWDALTIREHRWRGRDFGKRLGVIRSVKRNLQTPGGQESRNWGPPVATLYPTGPASAIHVGSPLAELARWLARFDPHYLLTYPSVAAALLEIVPGDRRPPALEEVRLISEPLDPEVEERLRREWGVRVTDVYSANEVGYIAFRCGEGNRLHVQSEAILTEILDEAGRPCGPGETGRVVVTALHNLATPLLRYELGDFATVGTVCPCGRSLPVLDRVMGRVRNMVRTPEGGRYWPAAFMRLRKVAPLRQFQLAQTALDTIELRAVLDRPMTPNEETQAVEEVREMLRYPFRVVVVPMAEISRGPTGKFEEFLSLLPD